VVPKFIQIYYKSCLIGIVISCVLQIQSVSASRDPTLKVLISKDKKVRIRSDKLIPLIIKGQRFSSKKIKGLTLKNENNRIIISFDKNKEKIYNLKNKDTFEVKSLDRRGIWVGQKRYAGKIKIFVHDNEILVVNVIGIEKYLSSVVGSEMPAKWPLEALKAQAIASRTYALKQKGNAIYNIDSTNKNQVYKGLEARTYKTTKAVNSTRSLVLTYKNKLINALFHSSSAGMTENSEDVWQNEYPYLSSVKDFDKNNPKLFWQKEFTNDHLQKLFPRIGGIKQIEILSITDTGRVKNIKIHGDFGYYQISGVDIRNKLGLQSTLARFKFVEVKENISKNENLKNLSKSTSDDNYLIHIVEAGESLYIIADEYNVSINDIVALNNIKDSSLININQRLLVPNSFLNELSSINKTLLVSGYGSGHGVGMSQWGAKYMANKGKKAENILKHFYKGVKVRPFKKYHL